MADAEREDGSVGGGPPAWLILLVTVVAAAAVVGGIVGYRAWRGDGDDEPVRAAPDPSAPATTAPAEAPATRLFTRATTSGVELRVDVQDADDLPFEMFPPADDDAPGVCRVVSQATVAAISDEEVLQAVVPITQDTPEQPSPMPLSSMAFGMGGVGMAGLVVQVPEDSRLARLQVPGASDEMEPIGGIAALIVPLPAGDGDADQFDPRFGVPQVDDMRLTVQYDDGRSVVVQGDDLWMGPPLWRGNGECFEAFNEPPPPPPSDDEDNPFRVVLPPAGEQPPDPAAARTAIDTAIQALYGAPDGPELYVLVDDPFAIRETFDRIGESGVGVDWTDVDPAIEELVFLSPVEAAFAYTLRAGDGWAHDEQFGRARLVDGTWRIGRGTICRDLQQFFATTCPP